MFSKFPKKSDNTDPLSSQKKDGDKDLNPFSNNNLDPNNMLKEGKRLIDQKNNGDVQSLRQIKEDGRNDIFPPPGKDPYSDSDEDDEISLIPKRRR